MFIFCFLLCSIDFPWFDLCSFLSGHLSILFTRTSLYCVIISCHVLRTLPISVVLLTLSRPRTIQISLYCPLCNTSMDMTETQMQCINPREPTRHLQLPHSTTSHNTDTRAHSQGRCHGRNQTADMHCTGSVTIPAQRALGGSRGTLVPRLHQIGLR